MDPGPAEYLQELADRIYNEALALDRAGEEMLATAYLEVVMQVRLEMAKG